MRTDDGIPIRRQSYTKRVYGGGTRHHSMTHADHTRHATKYKDKGRASQSQNQTQNSHKSTKPALPRQAWPQHAPRERGRRDGAKAGQGCRWGSTLPSRSHPRWTTQKTGQPRERTNPENTIAHTSVSLLAIALQNHLVPAARVVSFVRPRATPEKGDVHSARTPYRPGAMRLLRLTRTTWPSAPSAPGTRCRRAWTSPCPPPPPPG